MVDNRVNVLGVGISILNLDTAVGKITTACHDPRHSGFVTVTGVHGIVESQKDEDLKRIHNQSFLSTPDGMPMVWLGRLEGNKSMDRVYGPELMEYLFSQTEGTDLKHYFFGGAEGVAVQLRERLTKRFPGCRIVGAFGPPFRPLNEAEEAQLLDELQRLQPHCFWVGLSTPKQEKFMYDFLQRNPDINAGWGHGFTLFGVGAAFDFHAGRIKQAPRWIQRSGFEWLFRLCMDPKRLWKRYAISNSYFISRILLQKTGLKKYPIIR